jgi:nucleotide-binding universal stress UspA family protein
MIKGRAPFPIETIALAVAFSPRLEGLIAETRRIQLSLNARVLFIHAGKKTSDKQRQLAELLNKYGFSDADSGIFWEQGPTADVITRICKQEVVDLLVLGALQRENRMSYYIGTVSRDVSRKAKCSVLLLTNPSLQPSPFNNIAVNGHEHRKTPFTINTALYLAGHEHIPHVTVVSEVDVPMMAMSMAEDASEAELDSLKKQLLEDEKIRQGTVVDNTITSDVEIKFVTLSGRSGHSIGQYARTHQTDLLVVNSPDHTLSIFDRIFTHDIEYLLSDLPCNLLIVHSRINDPVD